MSEPLDTLNGQLASVRGAIARIESGGQSRRVVERERVEGELRVLYQREESLVSRIARLSRPRRGRSWSVVSRD